MYIYIFMYMLINMLPMYAKTSYVWVVVPHMGHLIYGKSSHGHDVSPQRKS